MLPNPRRGDLFLRPPPRLYNAYHCVRECQITSGPRKTDNPALPDVTLRLDLGGVIRTASLANSVSSEVVDSWVGTPWAETAGDPGGDEILGMLAAATAHGVSDFRQVTQLFPSGLALPIEYTVVRLGGQTGLMAIGRNVLAAAIVQARLVAAHHADEQASWKQRAAEARNRLLFEASDDPILLLRGDDFSIVEANPASIRAGALHAGRDFPSAIAESDRPAFRTMLAQVTEKRRAPGILVHIGAAAAPWLMRAEHAAGQADTMFLVRLSPAVPLLTPAHGAPSVEHLIERLPDGFAVIDHTGTIRRANRAFLDLVQGSAAAWVIGQPIGRFLSRAGADAAVLMANLRRHCLVRNFTTSLRGEHGAEAVVEISAAGDRDPDATQIALLVRDVTQRGPIHPAEPPAGAPNYKLLKTLGDLTTQIGAVPLLQLVHDAGAAIEQHCIETALERARGNRTATARLLGLSRQSLYAKLSRYGMGNEPGQSAPGD